MAQPSVCGACGFVLADQPPKTGKEAETQLNEGIGVLASVEIRAIPWVRD
jgi:hypothetical protein